MDGKREQICNSGSGELKGKTSPTTGRNVFQWIQELSINLVEGQKRNICAKICSNQASTSAPEDLLM